MSIIDDQQVGMLAWALETIASGRNNDKARRQEASVQWDRLLDAYDPDHRDRGLDRIIDDALAHQPPTPADVDGVPGLLKEEQR